MYEFTFLFCITDCFFSQLLHLAEPTVSQPPRQCIVAPSDLEANKPTGLCSKCHTCILVPLSADFTEPLQHPPNPQLIPSQHHVPTTYQHLPALVHFIPFPMPVPTAPVARSPSKTFQPNRLTLHYSDHVRTISCQLHPSTRWSPKP